jgi:hypothetical protein
MYETTVYGKTSPKTDTIKRWHVLRCVNRSERVESNMTKPLDQIDEVIHNPKHPFRQVGDRPEKPQKHRYERRKVKEFLKAGEWPGR